MKRTTAALTLALMLGTANNAKAQLVINELMQSNIDCIMDDLNDFPDSWVELYNAGTTTVSLADYKLGKNSKEKKAWQLPAQQVEAGGYVVVYCDKVGDGLHTDFRLESGKGGEVYLFAGGAVVDQVTEMKKQPAPNIAYGRKTDGDSKWGYQALPTPGQPNCGQTVKELLGQPLFSEAGRVMENGSAFSLTLSAPEGTPEGAEIRYTTDGSEPAKSSTLYTAPIQISSSRVIRATIFCDGYLSPRSAVESYIFHPRQLTLPVISIVIDKRYLDDAKIGIYVAGSYDKDKKNYEFNWRRPMNFEFFESAGTASKLNQLCETRIMGGASRGNPLKTLGVYANKRFGEKRLSYEFFPDQRPGITDFKSIMLRNAGNDFDYLYLRDAVIQRTMASHVDLDWQAWRPAIIYINGTYRGMLNIRERSNEDNIYTNYDGLEDIDMFENWWELKEGDWENYNQFRAFYAEQGHTLAEYATWMDWEEFLNLMLMNLYYNNQDFPGNNIVMWRPKTADGRWRWIAKDTDFGLGLYNSPASYNSIKWIYNPNYDNDHSWANKYEHTRLFRRLMDDADFKREFIDRAAIYMGDFLNERGTRAVWDPMYEAIRQEYPIHRKLYNEWWPNYSDEMQKARKWLSQRTNYFYQHLADYYKLGTPTPLTINTNLSDSQRQAISLTINGITLSEPLFDGKFFADRSITISAATTDGSDIAGWDMETIDSNGKSTKSHADGATLAMTMPKGQLVNISVCTTATSISPQQTKLAVSWHRVGSELIVTGVERGQHIALFDLHGRQLCHTIATTASVSLPIGTSTDVYILQVGRNSYKVR